MRALGQPALPAGPTGPSMTAISPAGMCFDAAGNLLRPAGAMPPATWWPPWWATWSPYRAARRERMPTMYTRPGSAWMAPPHETAMARLGAPPARPRPRSIMAARRLSALGQDEWDWGEFYSDGTVAGTFEAPAVEVPAIDTSLWEPTTSWFPSTETWSTIGQAAGTVIQAATPLALPLLQQAIFGTRAPAPRAPAPPGYTYSPTGQLVKLPAPPTGYTYSPTGQLVKTGATWTMPLLLIGGAAVVGGALYMTGGRRRRRR